MTKPRPRIGPPLRDSLAGPAIERVTIRLTKTEAAAMRDAAERSACPTLSDWIRQICNRAVRA